MEGGLCLPLLTVPCPPSLLLVRGGTTREVSYSTCPVFFVQIEIDLWPLCVQWWAEARVQRDQEARRLKTSSQSHASAVVPEPAASEHVSPIGAASCPGPRSQELRALGNEPVGLRCAGVPALQGLRFSGHRTHICSDRAVGGFTNFCASKSLA